jgi:hypothetical protein
MTAFAPAWIPRRVEAPGNIRFTLLWQTLLMGFGKPFRAVPVRLGPYYRQQQQRRSRLLAARMIGGAVAAGLAIGIIASVDSRPTARAYYANCDAARGAGVAPLHAGEPGYRAKLDRDGDGIACEPYGGL